MYIEALAVSNYNRILKLEVENRLFSAQLVSDVAMLDQLLCDDLITVTPTGQVVTKEMDLDSHRAKTLV